MELFCYFDQSHIRVLVHQKYYLGAAKTLVTGSQNVISLENETIPLK